jgi:hypothetical protein
MSGTCPVRVTTTAPGLCPGPRDIFETKKEPAYGA